MPLLRLTALCVVCLRFAMIPPSLAAGLFVVAAVCTSQASTILEVDFQSFDPTDRVLTANNVQGGATGALTASESGATVDAAATGVESGNPKLLKGAGECVATPEGGGSFSSSGPAGAYSKYISGQRGYGTGTLVTIFQPHFGGRLNGAGSNGKACLFATNYQGTSLDAIILGIGKEMTLSFGIGAAASPTRRHSIAQPEWDPNKWYFIAASWGPLEKPTIYWREIASESGEFAASENPLEDSTQEIRRGIRLGNCGVNTASLYGDMPMKGKMAYFLWTDTYTNSEEAYDALYKEVVKPK